jgi:hypothetical protein
VCVGRVPRHLSRRILGWVRFRYPIERIDNQVDFVCFYLRVFMRGKLEAVVGHFLHEDSRLYIIQEKIPGKTVKKMPECRTPRTLESPLCLSAFILFSFGLPVTGPPAKRFYTSRRWRSWIRCRWCCRRSSPVWSIAAPSRRQGVIALYRGGESPETGGKSGLIHKIPFGVLTWCHFQSDQKSATAYGALALS